MKNISKIISCLCLITTLALFPSCKKDLLKEEPTTFISADALFTTPAGYDQAVIGLYNDLQGFISANTLMLLEMCTDIYAEPSGSFEQALPTYQNTPTPFYYNTRSAWASAYTAIKDANFVIDRLTTSTILDATKKNALLGEARFVRAYSFFYLVQMYGDIPMPIKSITNYSETKISRTPQADVYKQILDDLNFAEANMTDNAVQTGRVYKLVATALLSKVYLTMAGNPLNKTEYFTQARDKALAVINSNKFSLVSDYSKVFHNLTYTTESIWEQLFVANIGGNPFHGLCATAESYKPILLPATWFVKSFPTGDQRKEWGIPQAYIDPKGKTLNAFFNKFVNTSYIDQGLTASSSGVIVNYTIPRLRLAEMYLIAAEAENEISGPTVNAFQYINKVRQRARVDKNNIIHVPDLAGLSKADFRTAVLAERKWELHLEGSTWFDMKRTNTFSNITKVRPTSLAVPIGAYNQTWLIPDNEVINNNIPQNPLYK